MNARRVFTILPSNPLASFRLMQEHQAAAHWKVLLAALAWAFHVIFLWGKGGILRNLGLVLLVAAGSFGCSSAGSEHGTAGSAADGGGATSGDATFFVDGTLPADGGSSADAGSPPFPNGGRQYKTIVDIVDPTVVQAIEAVLTDTTGTKDYSSATQAFYALYPDQYDFLYFFLDHQLPNAMAEASFDVVNRPAIPGTGIDTPVAHTTFGSRGRLRGATHPRQRW